MNIDIVIGVMSAVLGVGMLWYLYPRGRKWWGWWHMHKTTEYMSGAWVQEQKRTPTPTTFDF